MKSKVTLEATVARLKEASTDEKKGLETQCVANIIDLYHQLLQLYEANIALEALIQVIISGDARKVFILFEYELN